jgi:hypothetical protein
MDSLILNTLGFRVEDTSILLPDTRNKRVKERVKFGIEQIRLIEQQHVQESKKSICINVMIKYSSI